MDHDLDLLTQGADRDGIDKHVVGAVIHNDRHVLILRRSGEDGFLPGIEELPSGGAEPGEDLVQALARELAEEVGWRQPLQLDPGFVATFDYTTGSGRRARQFTFSLAHDGTPISLSAEHTSHRWITPDELAHTTLTAESKNTIMTWAGQAASRLQTG
ncbi:8-oxo-dGTP diphosphatase [Lipingzhangella halophila]|uniref:8-oxo-dGTP diphosphatase n=1 Tax=Lipingzhangella halophila TaxID=1783352 RepID=A0A7W7RNB3_9ACTN|nr:NUDIX domain-containing protein [Lipingzhangella halophila]MBB4935134.1 8-oxo-dGTP diphosphatase [Lipingzhangella halophila]